MAEPHELRFLLDAAGRQLTFPEEALPHEGSRRLLEFLGVKIVKTNAEIDADLDARFGERDLTARCQVCPEWKFTGLASEAVAAHVEHNASTEHSRNLLAAIDRGERVHLPKVRGMTMDKCRVCKKEPAPSRGMYAGIGRDCRAEGYVNKGGQIAKRQSATVGGGQSGGLPLPRPSEPPSEPAAAAEPEPEREPEPETPVASEPASEPSLNARVGRFLDAGEALGKVLVRHEQELAEARAEFDAAHAELPA